jgi:hypothetical protein
LFRPRTFEKAVSSLELVTLAQSLSDHYGWICSRRIIAWQSAISQVNRIRSFYVTTWTADHQGFVLSCRAREDELLYVLRKLLELRLWAGSMWAALSDDPTKSCVEQPGEHFQQPILSDFFIKMKTCEQP